MEWWKMSPKIRDCKNGECEGKHGISFLEALISSYVLYIYRWTTYNTFVNQICPSLMQLKFASWLPKIFSGSSSSSLCAWGSSLVAVLDFVLSFYENPFWVRVQSVWPTAKWPDTEKNHLYLDDRLGLSALDKNNGCEFHCFWIPLSQEVHWVRVHEDNEN